MEENVYSRMNALEAGHWWFVARRRIVSAFLKQSCPDTARPSILEAGCGTGGNLAMLAGFGDVHAFEPSEGARASAAAKHDGAISQGHLPDGIPFGDTRFDVVVMLDVLEHVERDLESLEALRRRLAPGGRILITVPALPWLWSRHDEVHHHFRRYTRTGLSSVLEAAGFRIVRMSYFNTLLFPLIAGIRVLKKLAGQKDAADDSMPGPMVNRALTWLFSLERRLLARVSFPIGVSLIAVAENPA